MPALSPPPATVEPDRIADALASSGIREADGPPRERQERAFSLGVYNLGKSWATEGVGGAGTAAEGHDAMREVRLDGPETTPPGGTSRRHGLWRSAGAAIGGMLSAMRGTEAAPRDQARHARDGDGRRDTRHDGDAGTRGAADEDCDDERDGGRAAADGPRRDDQDEPRRDDDKDARRDDPDCDADGQNRSAAQTSGDGDSGDGDRSVREAAEDKADRLREKFAGQTADGRGDGGEDDGIVVEVDPRDGSLTVQTDNVTFSSGPGGATAQTDNVSFSSDPTADAPPPGDGGNNDDDFAS